MIEVKQAKNHSVQFYGIHIPKGAVYAVIPARTIKGRFMPKVYAWIDDLEAARNRRHFTMHILSVNDRKPRSVYVDGHSGYAHEMQNFILLHLAPEDMQVKRGATRREIRPDAPKDRSVGRYIMRGTPSYDTAPSVMTQDYVTNGCKVGKNFYNEEGYCGVVLGMGIPSYR